MKANWTQGLNEENKKKLEDRLKANYQIFDRLKGILDGFESVEVRRATSADDFNTDWSHRQAYIMGKLKAYAEVKSLLNDLTS